MVYVDVNWNFPLVFSVVMMRAVIMLNCLFWNASFCPLYSHVFRFILKLWCHEISDFPVKSSVNASGDLYVSPCFKEHIYVPVFAVAYTLCYKHIHMQIWDMPLRFCYGCFFPFNIPFLIHWFCRGKRYILQKFYTNIYIRFKFYKRNKQKVQGHRFLNLQPKTIISW